MKFGYKKLWKLLIDKDMKKNDFIQAAGISRSSITKLVHDESDIVEIIDEEAKKNE